MSNKSNWPFTGLGNRGHLKVINNTKLIKGITLTLLKSIWKHSEPSEFGQTSNWALVRYFLGYTVWWADANWTKTVTFKHIASKKRHYENNEFCLSRSFFISHRSECWTEFGWYIFLFYFSGYGSQALSSNTLSSDDSMSLRSISVDGTPDTELIPRINEDFKAKVTMQQPLEASQKGHHRPTAASLASTAGAGDLLSPPDIRYHSYIT